MSPPPRSEREEERRLNLRTLVIASVASATAALVTSRLWIAGTWIAAAMTPVIVALVSELLHRPTDRIARGLTTDREALPDPEAPARRVAERLRSDAPQPDPEAPRALPPRAEPPVRIYRTEGSRSSASRAGGGAGRASGAGRAGGSSPGRGRRIAYRAVLVTAALAFAIGAVALTVSELIAGNSFGKSDRRTTLIPTTRNKSDTRDNDSNTKTTPEQTDTTQQQTTETTPPTDTGTDTTQTPAPTGGQDQTDTTGTTSTTPSQP